MGMTLGSQIASLGGIASTLIRHVIEDLSVVYAEEVLESFPLLEVLPREQSDTRG